MTGEWWISETWQTSPVLTISWAFWVIFSVVLHELGHGVAAIRAGDRTPIESGHMTWNPLVHMGPVSLIVFGLVGIAWGAMPVSPSRFRGRYDQLVVSGAGPAVNIGLAVVTGIAGGLWAALAGGFMFESVSASDGYREGVATFLWIGCALNFTLALFNLLPVPPLDGSRMLADVSAGFNRLLHHPNAQYIGLAAFLLVFWFGGQLLFEAGFWAERVIRTTVAGLFGA